MKWKIMTFNLRTNVPSDGDHAWPHRPRAVAQAILRHDPDIVCVQEALYAMLLDLVPLLPDYAWVGEGRRGGQEDEFCAVWYKKSKASVAEYGSFGLSETPGRLGEPDWGGGLSADVHVGPAERRCSRRRGGSGLTVFNTHLDHISEPAQTNGMRLIVDRIGALRERTGTPVALTGDFNVGPSHAVVKGLERAGFINGYSALSGGAAAAGATFHDFRGGKTGEPIDYIFASPDVAVERIEVDRGLYEGRYPSDHYPVCAVLSTK
ncbi:endonuclease/exonuclease/phosphatase family protein [Cohnella rhizosphaerae]|uniref:Endonuclease/exonuclease/phosphatase family protein n=1 Tax=Cohnella rhizosphaerae TaxID=1457232 RepID=A0A9X4QTP6_9BACL|nr:endonuclease/exonuclease/phosphatase family protein [Cohnella rhizosphaerae]MDG0811391.1 endonuclease/exonuclease/phosphatase family protein [Cohnella rhizosphaerae]